MYFLKLLQKNYRKNEISPDTVLNAKKTKAKRKLSFEIFSDLNNKAAKAFGLAFKVDKETLGVYQKFGIDLKTYQENDQGELPMPGTYIIDKSGVIRYSFVDPDYTVRAEPTDVLKVLRQL
ncbi:MAG: redoxin domain-containing protein [Bacteriovoracaceae bacterium]|nr:redoxin domain-containing protein [Bacteriovoracaceae bacterium]